MVDPRRTIRDENLLPEAPREWLIENGLGGYASATIAGAITRRYHGFLIAAQPAPLGRMVVLNDLEVDVEFEDGSVVNLREKGRFLDFTLSMGLPSWRYELDGVVIEKSIVVPSRQNIVHSTFRSLGDGKRVRLRLTPFINLRRLEVPVSEPLSSGYALTVQGHRYEITAGPDLPTLRLAMEGCEGPTFTADGGSRHECFYEIEAQCGYDSRG
jgi:glycogen debranching enzyme